MGSEMCIRDSFQTLAEMSKATFAAAEPGKSPDFVRPFAGYLGPEARLLLLICEKLGDAGASQSLKALMADVNDGVSMVDDLNKRSGWAIAPGSVNAGIGEARLSQSPSQQAPPRKPASR